ncbi:MAG: TrkH family potassium uptake protein [Oscillospiraceae bacterium]|nr:TrkH family potassium uptake protein [Oscillospiraceae bacterium]
MRLSWRIVRDGSNLGTLILLVGLLLAVPLLALPFFPEEAGFLPAFLIPAAASAAVGCGICLSTYQNKADDADRLRSARQGAARTLVVWAYSFLMGALPFVLAGQLDFVQALFESVSGWTTTGLSVVDVAATPRIFLLHRSFMQYCGGVGFVLMITMVVSGKQSMALYSAEGHPDMIRPNLRQTSRRIMAFYAALLAAGTLLYRVFGMDLFDAVCHAMSALATAGFTTQPGGIGSYGSLPIEAVTTALMLIGASNFAVLLLLTQGKLRQVFKVTEMRFMFGLLAVFIPLMTGAFALGSGMGFWESLRHAVFGTVAAFSTTGYALTEHTAWPQLAFGLMMLLIFIGGSMGSTSGGIKLLRAYFVLRITRENVRKRFSPAIKTVAPTYTAVRGKVPIDAGLVSDTFGFIACYAGIIVAGTLLLTLTADCSVFEAMFEFASVFGTSGITAGLTNASTNTPTLIVEMVGMTLGRLEIFAVFIGLVSGVRWAKGLILRRKG